VYDDPADGAGVIGEKGDTWMNINIGPVDAMIRAILGIALIAATVFGVIGLWGFIGMVMVVTSLKHHCPVYRVLGMNTCAVS
jgi:hypothetical protein